MIRLLLILSVNLYAIDIEAAHLMVESSSYIRDGKIIYVDRSPGAHGERGPYQMSLDAFVHAGYDPDMFKYLDTDMDLAREAYKKYMRILRKRSKTDIEAAVRWNIGPTKPLSKGAVYKRRLYEADKRR